jgi:LPXTG-motif cell wall-anchored protein
VNALGMLVALALLSSPSPASTDWTVVPLSGAAISAPGTTANPLLIPGQSSTSGYLITHTDAIDGPLDVTATTTDPRGSFEDHLFVTVEVNGGQGQTGTLGALLRHSDVLRATNALPSGPVVLTVKIELDPASTAAQRLRQINFTLFVTVSNEVVQLPSPGHPPSTSGGGSALAYTGQVISGAAILLGCALSGFGIVLLLRRRRRSAATTDVQRAA